MLNKIAFLCVTPLEGFLIPMFQSCVKEYYRWMCRQAQTQRKEICCMEHIEVYGERPTEERMELFSQTIEIPQFLYVQTHRKELLEGVFEEADLVVMGVSGCRKEFDKIFMSIFPWKDQIMFFWDQYTCRGEEYIKQICNEYKLREAQVIELKGSFYREGQMLV